MQMSTAYLPGEVFAPQGASTSTRVFIAPQRYVQGPGVLRSVGRFLSLTKSARAGLLMSRRGLAGDGSALREGCEAAGIEVTPAVFGGECSIGEIDGHVAALRTARIDVVIAAGGGKCIDAGKAVAFRLGCPVVVVPTLASNDAPCSALSVLYTPEGVSSGVEFYPQSPALVVVDTEVVAQAPERYLVAGMGDAMATWYEADVCLQNPAAASTLGARPTLASAAIGAACARCLFESGPGAAASVRAKKVDRSVEDVVEANTLLSGLGFESGGLAAAHGVAQSLTAIPVVHDGYLHGEMVAMGTLVQLAMQGRRDEAVRVAEFFATVGLPVHLGQLSLDPGDARALDTICAETLGFPFIGNMPMRVTAEIVRSSILEAHRLGLSVAKRTGDAAYRRLHGN